MVSNQSIHPSTGLFKTVQKPLIKTFKQHKNNCNNKFEMCQTQKGNSTRKTETFKIEI